MTNTGVVGWEEISPYDVGNEVKSGGNEKASTATESARHPDELKQDEKWVLPPSSPGSTVVTIMALGMGIGPL